MTAEDSMFQEVFSAIEQGDRSRARDLLTRLLRRNQANADYWLWMSAVVDTTKERIYCLKEAHRIDPQNQAARRGLVFFGVIPPDETLVVPTHLQRRNWQVHIEKPVEKAAPISWKRMVLYAGGALVVVGLILVAIFGNQLTRQREISNRPTISFQPGPSATSAEAAALPPTPTPTPRGPTPPWEALAATYTPTPAYGRTPHPVIEAYSIAMRAYDRQEWDRVITYMAQAATSQPDAPDLQYWTGEALRYQDQARQALVAYNRAISSDSTYAPAFLGRARANLAIGSAPQADIRRDLEIAVNLDPNLPEARLELALLELENDNTQAALEQIEAAALLLPGSPLVYAYRARIYLAQGEPELALQDAQQANRLDITMLPVYLLLGEAYQANDRLAESIVPLEVYVNFADAPDAAAYAWLGRAYAAGGDVEGALEVFAEALRLDRRNYPVLMQRGFLYLETGQAREALADFNLALELRANDFAAAVARSRALLAIEAYGDAYIQLNRAEGAADTDALKAELYYWRAQSLETLNVQAAINDWQRLLALPEGSAPEEWLEQARGRLEVLITPTSTPPPTRTATPTQTRMPTQTFTPPPATRTPSPGPATLTQTAPPATRTPTRTPTPSRTP